MGRGFFSYGTGEFVDEPSLWDPSDTTSQEITNDAYLTLLRSPFIFSWSEKSPRSVTRTSFHAESGFHNPRA